jgi:tRNA A58 N-methylase Trm61
MWSQLVITTEDIARNLDNNQQVDMLILDFSKAFDTVPHKRLLKKLESYGWLLSRFLAMSSVVMTSCDSHVGSPQVCYVCQDGSLYV